MTKHILTVALLLSLVGCIPPSWPIPPQPVTVSVTCAVSSDGQPMKATCSIAGLTSETSPETGHAHFIGIPRGVHTLRVTAEGYHSYAGDYDIQSDTTLTVGLEKLPPPPVGRKGLVRMRDRTFTDDDGDYLPLGTTLFWAGWGYDQDRDRLEANLKWIKDQGIDYIRVLGTVGDPLDANDSWHDRAMGTFMPNYNEVIAGVTDLAYDKYGLRIMWTLFGGSPYTETAAARTDVVNRFVQMSRGREHKIQFWECANEASENGFDVDFIRNCGQVLRNNTPVLVSLSSAQHLGAPGYIDGPQHLCTMHLERSTSGTGGVWRPIRQPWEGWQVEGCDGKWANSEGVGPGSSITSNSDPLQMSMYAGLTWLSGGGTFVLHSGAGVLGKPFDAPTGHRPANVWEQPNIEPILAGIRSVRSQLPLDLPNWERQNSNSNFPNYPFETEAIQDLIDNGEQLLRAFATIRDGRFYLMPLVAKVAIPFQAKYAMRLRVYEPLTAQLAHDVNLDAGQTFMLPPTDAAIMVGEPR